ncbi:MAG: carboxypeptidase-like regulatory domain-containing protein, partial [Gemmataceae bacterium]
MTDANGRWKLTNVPNRPDLELDLFVTHPDHRSDDIWNETAKTSGVTAKQLRDGTAKLTMKAGVIVRGRVTDPDGNPVKDAIVIHGKEHYFRTTTSKFVTDADGKYRLPALPPGSTHLTVQARGFAPQHRSVELKDGMADQNFKMTTGKPAKLRFLNANGQPMPKVYVQLEEWKGIRSIHSMHDSNHPKVPSTGVPSYSDANGVWEWANAPDTPVKVLFITPGFALQEFEITGGTTDKTVTLKPEHRITGTVTDSETGKPIPNFTVIPVDVFSRDFLSTERGNAVVGEAGRLSYHATRTDIPLRIRVEAMGYRSQDGPEFRVGDDLPLIQNFKLKPSPARTGIVTTADGKPVAGAVVCMATPIEKIDTDDYGNNKTTTNANGQFAFPDCGEPWRVIARTEKGYATAEAPADRADIGTLKLQPWATVRGTFHDGGKPVDGATIIVNVLRHSAPDRPRLQDGLHVKTGPDGRFEFANVPPGPVTVRVLLGPWQDDGFRSG